MSLTRLLFKPAKETLHTIPLPFSLSKNNCNSNILLPHSQSSSSSPSMMMMIWGMKTLKMSATNELNVS